MSELGFKVIKHNNWLGSSSEDEEQQQKFKPKKELKIKEQEQETETNIENEHFKGKVQSYDEAIALIEKYKDKKLSLKMKALVKKAKKLIKVKNEETTSSQGKTDQERFSKGRSIFDTKKGQVLFELQKSYKGDSRFKLDERFAEDIDAAKLPNSIKLLTTGIDFKNLSDGSDTEFKSNSRKQKKIARKEEKKRSNENKVEKEEIQEKKDSNKKRAFFEIEDNRSDNNEEDEEEEFFVKKVVNKNEDQNSSEEEDDEEEDEDQQQVDEEENTKQSVEENTINSLDDKQQFMTEEEIYGQRFRENDDKDFIDQEGLESDVESIDLPDELNGYLRILQDLLPEDKLFFQNKRKNLKIVNNSFAGYGTMLSKQEQIAVENKNKKKKNQKQDDNEEDKGQDKKKSSKEADENEDKIKKEKSYNLVIPRFDPSQLIVKKVMETQEKERSDKLKEKELGATKKAKKITVEAKIEAGIDKKAQNIIKANSILDKNLGEHQKLEGITVIKRKAPVLKKLKIDLDKWKNIIQSSMQTESTDAINQIPQEQENKSKEIPQEVAQKQVVKNSQNLSQIDKKSSINNNNNNTNNRSSTISTNLGFLFATAPSTVDPSRNQFKLFK